MEPAVFPVLLDSCVLYPYELRDLLLEDTVRNLVADGRTSREQASRFRTATSPASRSSAPPRGRSSLAAAVSPSRRCG